MAAGQATAFYQVELHAGWTDRAVERPWSLALRARAVTFLTLGLLLLQTQNTKNALFILDALDLHCLCGHLWVLWVPMTKHREE